MGIDKGWMAGSTAMLLLRLLEERDQMCIRDRYSTATATPTSG